MKRKILAGLLALALTCTSAMQFLPGDVRAEDQKDDVGTTYYVSSRNGDDLNKGTSEDEAFATLDKINEITLQPGDEVLLERGSVFEDQYLHVKGSGDAKDPIIISAYGEGDMPQINANGKGVWYQDFGKPLDNANHKYKGNVSTALLLNDVEYIEISDLEITNDRDKGIDDADKGLAYNDQNVMDRTGVASCTSNIGTADHIVLDNLYIHDVDGNVYNKHMLNGGIYFITALPKNEEETGISRYNDIQIKNCRVDTVNRWGIALSYTAYWDKFKTKAISDEICQKYGATNVLVENNYIKDAGGDSITTMYCYRPMVQNNVSEGAARQINTTDYSQTSFGRVAAAIWPWKCKDAVFQYNECFNTLNAASGNGDGQAWDADWGDGTLYQYNYSHGNTGGAVMFCGEQAYRNTFRYNISQEDLLGVLNLPSQPDAHVYNNTFYMKENVNFIRQSGMASNGKTTLENNIIYYSGETPRTENWNPGGRSTYDNNLYYNYTNVPSSDKNAIQAAKGTQVMADPGTAPTSTEGKAQSHNNPDEKTVFDGYKLVEDSLAVNAGKIIKDESGKAVEKDFFGKNVGAIPEIGAAESDAVTLAIRSDVYDIADGEISGLVKGTTVEQFLANLIYDDGVTIVVKNASGDTLHADDVVKGGMSVELTFENDSATYSIAANKDNELKSSIFMVEGSTIYVPSTEKNPMSVEEVKAGVTVHETATVSVRNNDTEVTEGNATEGMTLRITAENGDMNDFNISVKNDYQWALDYAGNVQGNVWFAQMRTSDTDYKNLTDYDPQYPNWVVDQWYGPGVDLPNHTTPTDENTHGLLSDTTGPTVSEGMAMTFRAPKDGYVSFNVKDDEPYLRQSGNAGGSVELKLTVNGETIQSCVLEESKVQGDFPAVEKLKVEKGDFIRVEAKNNGKPTKPSIHVTPEIQYLNESIEEETETLRPAVLAYLVELAKEQKENGALEGVVESVVEIFETRLEYAESLLAKVEQGETGVTQSDLDKATEELLEAMHYLSFKADKTDLLTVIGMAEDLTANKEEYIASTYEPFEKALKSAKAVAEDKSALQDEIDESWHQLLTAMANLRFQPDKSKLEELLAAVKDIDTRLYTKETVQAFAKAYAYAEDIYEKEDADTEEVTAAYDGLKEAYAALKKTDKRAAVEKVQANAGSGNSAGTASKTNTATGTKKVKASAKTGDTGVWFPVGVMFTAALTGAAMVLKKRK